MSDLAASRSEATPAGEFGDRAAGGEEVSERDGDPTGRAVTEGARNPHLSERVGRGRVVIFLVGDAGMCVEEKLNGSGGLARRRPRTERCSGWRRS